MRSEQKSIFFASACLSIGTILLWSGVTLFILSNQGVASFNAGNAAHRVREKLDFVIPLGVTLFLLSLPHIAWVIRHKPNVMGSVGIGLFLPPVAGVISNAIPLLSSGPLRGEGMLLLLLPIYGFQFAGTLVPFWIVFCLLLKHIASRRSVRVAWVLAITAVALSLISIAVLVRVRISSERPFAAIKNHDLQDLERQLRSGHSANATDFQGVSLLQYAVFERSYEITELLLKSGANADYVNKWGHTALAEVGPEGSTQENERIFSLVLAHSTTPELDQEAFWQTIRFGAVNRLEQLVKRGSTFHVTYSEPAIREALDKKNLKLLAALIRLGSDVNAIDSYLQRTPLMLAASSCYQDAVQLLLENGADVNLKDRNGKTALEYLRCEEPERASIIEYFRSK